MPNKRCTYRSISEMLILIFAAECVFGGSGRWITIGPISIRMFLFALAFLGSLPYVFKERKRLVRVPYLWAVIALGAVLCVAAVNGYRLGNSKRLIAADMTAFLTFALLPGILVMFREPEKLKKLLLVIFFSALFVALQTIMLHFILALVKNARFVNTVARWLTSHSIGGLAVMQTGIYRVYLRSQIFLQFAAIYGFYLIRDSRGGKRVALLLCEGAMMFAIIVTYTRGFWIGSVFSGLLVVILDNRNRKKTLVSLGWSLCVMAVLLLLSCGIYRGPYVLVEIVNRVDPNLIVLRVPDEQGGDDKIQLDIPVDDLDSSDTERSNEAAVEIRKETLIAMRRKIHARPISGNGLGTTLEGLRDDGKTEYMYQDMTMKLGYPGLAVFLAVYFLPILSYGVRWLQCRLKKRRWQEDSGWDAYVVAAYAGVALTSAFNPFLTAPMGVLMACLAMAARCANPSVPTCSDEEH